MIMKKGKKAKNIKNSGKMMVLRLVQEIWAE